jgi:hypothetical protein
MDRRSADKAPSGKLEATILAWGNGETLWNPKEKTLLLSRLIRLDHSEALVSDQRGHLSVLLANGSHLAHCGKGLVVGRKR